MLIGADIGGTKTLLEARTGGTCVLRRRYEGDDYASFDDLLAHFLQTLRGICFGPFKGACLAVAGPVAGQQATVTNRPAWQLDAAALRARHGIGPVLLVNDFAAVAAGLDTLLARERVCLQAGNPPASGLRLALGPGTGLGVAALDGGRLLASEGGHVAFAPLNADMLGLWQSLQGGTRRVTNEMVVSGNGLLACYRYCLHAAHGIAPELLAPAIVVKRALEEQDPIARRALDLFARCFGAVAGDLALSFLARGGVYLAGGITAKVLPALQAPGFIEAFNAKAQHAGLVTGIPVFAVLADDIGLRGALCLAAQAR